MKSKHDDKRAKHWERRPERRWEKFEFNQPYSKGRSRLRTVLDQTNFDPAVLWQWGTMQAMAVIEILKAAERSFGREGQKLVSESLYRVGYDVGKQMTDGTSIPDDMTSTEWISFFATVINRIAYASLETPEIEEDGSAYFHIDWCPHQDHYAAFDCRVQRYFVQGMIDAGRDFMKSRGREDAWDVAFETTIPSGGETCLFRLRRGSAEEVRAWGELTRLIEEKALRVAATEPKQA
ncbi:MAG: hypothetical protein HY725_00400 [Candidatus Rokubacteria bacterium]|nr:hypothetical protein [Candidatus Rokubacteria bacterium]